VVSRQPESRERWFWLVFPKKIGAQVGAWSAATAVDGSLPNPILSFSD
jgi:hypothetical protein